MIVLDFVLLGLTLVLLLPVVFFLLQIVAAIIFKKSSLSAQKLHNRPAIAIVIPAHNESLMIAQTIQSLLPQLQMQDNLLVVADNCTDDTAAIASSLGANVFSRTHEFNRGKGYALDYGLQQLRRHPPDVVLVIDADCIVAEGTIDLLVKYCIETQRPVQALYLMQSLSKPSLKACVSQFAWLVKNKVRPSGLKCLGLPCQLMGTGMAFLWQDISQVNLASGHIVEDMKLGIDLARINKAPVFLPDAIVTSMFPPSIDATNAQRTRWEHGHLSVLLKEAPSILLEAIKGKNLQMLAMVIDIMIPPLAVLALLCAGLFALSFAFNSQLAFFIASLLLASLGLAVFLAWLFFGREMISFRQLCYAPIYAFTKIPLYIKFFINRQVDWVRSKRD